MTVRVQGSGSRGGGPRPAGGGALRWRSPALIAAAVVLVLGVSGCGSSGSGGSQTPLQQGAAQLQSEDASAGSSHPASAYSAELAKLATQCTQTDPVQLANMTDAVEAGLVKAGVSQDRLSLLQAFSASIPAGAPVNCVDIFAAYQTLRVEG